MGEAPEQVGECLNATVVADDQDAAPEAKQVGEEVLDIPTESPPECAADHSAVGGPVAQDTEMEPEATLADQGVTDEKRGPSLDGDVQPVSTPLQPETEKCVKVGPLPHVAVQPVEKSQPSSFLSCCRAVPQKDDCVDDAVAVQVT